VSVQPDAPRAASPPPAQKRTQKQAPRQQPQQFQQPPQDLPPQRQQSLFPPFGR